MEDTKHLNYNSTTNSSHTLNTAQVQGWWLVLSMKRCNFLLKRQKVSWTVKVDLILCVCACVSAVQLAVEETQKGAFYNQGQCCTAASRVFVEESIYEEFLRCSIEKAKKIVIGDPLDPQTSHGPQVGTHRASHNTNQQVLPAMRDSFTIFGGSETSCEYYTFEVDMGEQSKTYGGFECLAKLSNIHCSLLARI